MKKTIMMVVAALMATVSANAQFDIPITIDARYQIGLTKLNKESIPGVNDSKNSVFTLTVGYKFGF